MIRDPKTPTDPPASNQTRNILLGAGLGLVFGAALGNPGIGLVLGAGGGVLAEKLMKRSGEK